MGKFVSMLTSHSSWEEWFPPGLRGLTYLTSRIFTMVASASLWGRRSEFQTSSVITDFSANPLLCSPAPHLFLLPPPPDLLHFQVFFAPSLECSWLMFCPPAVTLPNYHFSLPKSPSYSGIASFFLSLFLVTCLFGLMFLQRPAPRPIHSATQPLSHPLTKPPLLHLWLAALTLTKTPACGSTVYFL